MRIPAALFLICMTGLALPTGIYRIGNGVSPHAVIRKNDPEYTDEARMVRITGAVMVHGVVGEDGRAHGALVRRSLGFDMDESAIQTLNQEPQWQSRPPSRLTSVSRRQKGHPPVQPPI
jgi:TonB family protein